MKDASGPEQGLKQRCVMMPSTGKVKTRWHAWGNGRGGVGRGVRAILMVVRGEDSLDSYPGGDARTRGVTVGFVGMGRRV